MPRVAAGVLLLILAVVGCAERGGDRLTLWHQMRPDDRAVLDERLAEFERQNPGVEVRALYKETEELRSGLESAVLVGHGPDIVYGPSDPVGVYQEIGALQDLAPWFDAAERRAFDPRSLITLPSKADPGSRQLVFVGDRFGNHVALVYNRNLVKTPPRTTDDLVRIAKEQTVDEDGDGRPERYGLVWNYTEPFFVIPFLTGHGAWVFDEKPGADGFPVPALDTPESVAAYRFVASLRSKERVLPASADYNAASELFLSGKAAMILNGDWSWQQYLGAPGIDAAVAVLPEVSATGLPMAPMVSPKGYSLSVAAREPARAALAARLIGFLTSAETQQAFLDRQRIIPSRLAVREGPLLRTDPTLRVSWEQLERGRPMPIDLRMRAVWDAMRPPYQKLMAGNATPEEAAAEMQGLALRNVQTLTQEVGPDATAPLVTWAGVALLVALAAWRGGALVALARDVPRNPLAYALVAPAAALIFVTVLFPLAYNVVLSFSNMSLNNFRDWRIVGLHNYAALVTGADARFWAVFAKTLVWTVVNVTLHVAIGVFLAVVLNGPVRGKGLYRVGLVLPWAVPAYITALTWRGMFDFDFGAVNQALAAVGLPPVNWLNEAGPAFAACIVANVWLGFPFMMVVALGGLQGIPRDLYEAARIDRATRWQQFWHVTVPMLRPVMLPAITLGAVWTFNNLNVVWLVSNGGEPADQTHILVSYVYKAVFNLYQYGYGAALSMVIFLMLLAFSVTFLHKTKAATAVA